MKVITLNHIIDDSEETEVLFAVNDINNIKRVKPHILRFYSFLTLNAVAKQPFYKKFLNKNKYYKCRNHGDDTCSHLSFPGCLIK